MPLPEGYLPRKGDVLVIHVETRFDVGTDDREGKKLYVHVHPVSESRYPHFRVGLDEIVALHCRKWEPGQQVRVIEDRRAFGEVVAVHGEQVWVQMQLGSVSAGDMKTLAANALEKMPEPETAPETPEPIHSSLKPENPNGIDV